MKTNLIKLPKIEDHRGNLTFIQFQDYIPFEIKRVHWVYDVPGDEERGGHALRNSHELIIALSGSFDVVLNDGTAHQTVSLRRSYLGLHVPPLIWRQLTNFSTNSLALIISSSFFDQSEYLYTVEELLNDR